MSTTSTTPASTSACAAGWRGAWTAAMWCWREPCWCSPCRWPDSNSCLSSSSPARTAPNCWSTCAFRKARRSPPRCARWNAWKRRWKAGPRSTTPSASSAPARRASICRWTSSSPPPISPNWSSPPTRWKTAKSWRSGSSRCCAATSPPSAAACRGWRTGPPSATRCSSASAATRSRTCARWPKRSRPRSAPTSARPTCSSTGTNRPNVRCASRSTSRRRVSWASVPATSRTSWR
ncbi:hypothetical protein D3C85_1117220 [compost metagenome]